jgi:ubiquinone/menaquinone biosynthesis C-methylase UbiE
MMRKQGIVLCGVLLLAVFLSCALAISYGEIARLGKVMDWKAGQTIADIGAGKGEFGFAAADIVGDAGKVYLTELDEKKLQELTADVKKRGTKNIAVVQATEKETKLPDNCCEGIILRRVYHHLTAPKEMDASLLRSLKPGGVLAVIDFPPRKWLSESDPVKGVPANRGGHGIPKKILLEEMREAGFEVDKIFDDWPEDSYCVLLRKATQQR